LLASTFGCALSALCSRSCLRGFASAISLLILAAAPPAAHAQLNVLSPAFSRLNGGAVWGSVGYRTSGSSNGDDRPLSRLGFAAFYGPFGGRGDTVVTFTRAVSDSTDTTLVEPNSRQIFRRTRSTHELRGDTRLPGNGKVILLVGYQHSTFFRFGTARFPATVPLGGAFIGTLLGPYPLLPAPRWLAWYGGVGGTIVRLSGIATRADTVAAELNTERTFAPEALLMIMGNVAPSYRVVFGASYQYVRFGSVTYRAVQSGDRIPAAILATLPEAVEARAVHLSLGFSFTASGLIPGR